MKHLKVVLFSFFTLIALISLFGCNGSAGDDLQSSNPVNGGTNINAPLTSTKTVIENQNFYLHSAYSDLAIEAPANTLANNTVITLNERDPSADESSTFGSVFQNLLNGNLNLLTSSRLAVSQGNTAISKIYTLKANSSQYKTEKLDKALTLTLTNNFSDYSSLFFVYKTPNDKECQFIKFVDISEIPQSLSDSILAQKTYGQLKIKLYTLDIVFAILAIKDEQVAASNSIKYMISSAKLINSDNTWKIRFSTCMFAEKTSEIFDRSTVTSNLHFFTNQNESYKYSSLKVNNSLANFNIQINNSGSSNYINTIKFYNYLPSDISISGNQATYSFTLDFGNLSINDIPATYTLDTLFVTSNNMKFSSENIVGIIKPIATGTYYPATYTPDIGTGTSDISTYTPDIGTGTSDISTYTPDIGTGTSDISTYTPDIGSGTQDIGSGTQDIGSGTQDIGSGTQDIGSGTQDIGSGTQDIGSGTQDIGSGTQDIGSGTQDIGSGTQDIGSGTQDIGSGTQDLGSGTPRI